MYTFYTKLIPTFSIIKRIFFYKTSPFITMTNPHWTSRFILHSQTPLETQPWTVCRSHQSFFNLWACNVQHMFLKITLLEYVLRGCAKKKRRKTPQIGFFKVSVIFIIKAIGTAVFNIHLAGLLLEIKNKYQQLSLPPCKVGQSDFSKERGRESTYT